MILKLRYMTDLAARSMLRRKGKYLVVFMAYAWSVFLLASTVFFAGALRAESLGIAAHAPELTIQRIVAGRQVPVDAPLMERIEDIRGVTDVTPRRWGYLFDPGANANYTVMERPDITDGTMTAGSGVARMRGAYPGDVLTFTGYAGHTVRLTLTETFDADTDLATADIILVSPSDFTALTGMQPGVYTDLAVSIANPAEILTIAEKTAAFPGVRPVSRSQVESTYEALFTWRSAMAVLIFAAVLMAFILIAWDRATGLSQDEVYEIGVLRGIGWDTGDIIRAKFMEGALVSAGAFFAGVAAAYLHVFAMGAPLLAGIMKGWSTLMPSFSLVPAVEPVEVFALFFFTVMPFTLATIYPVWRAAAGDPSEVMR